MTRAQALAAKVANQLMGSAEVAPEIAVAAPPVEPSPAPVPAPEVKVMSHDEWANNCQGLLPEGAQIEKDQCVYSLSGEMFAQKCKQNETGAMALEGAPMKVQMSVEPAVVPMPESPEEPGEAKAASAEVEALKAQLEATNAKLAEAQAQIAKADNEARDAAFASSGIKPDLADLVKGSATRKDGETWGQAVARIQMEKPSAFESKAQASTTPAPIEIGRQRHMPQGAALAPRMVETAGASVDPLNQDARKASANARKMLQ